MTAISHPVWLSKLKQSIKYNKQDRASSWFQLATVRPNGNPGMIITIIILNIH